MTKKLRIVLGKGAGGGGVGGMKRRIMILKKGESRYGVVHTVNNR
jgi:hypothetical protein